MKIIDRGPITVQLDPVVVGSLLTQWRVQRSEVIDQRDALNARIAIYDRDIAALENASNQHRALSPTGRLTTRRSEGFDSRFPARAVMGAALQLQRLRRRTGTTYATAHRIIKLLAEQDQVYQSEDTNWHWKGAATDQESLV